MNKQTIDQFNILDLLNMSQLSPDDQSKFLAEMEINIVDEFMLLRLDKILTEDQVSHVNSLTKANKDLKEIISYVQSQVPNFNILLLEFARVKKIEIIQNHFEIMIEEMKKFNPKNESIEKIKLAQSFAENGNWQDLYQLWLP